MLRCFCSLVSLSYKQKDAIFSFGFNFSELVFDDQKPRYLLLDVGKNTDGFAIAIDATNIYYGIADDNSAVTSYSGSYLKHSLGNSSNDVNFVIGIDIDKGFEVRLSDDGGSTFLSDSHSFLGESGIDDWYSEGHTRFAVGVPFWFNVIENADSQSIVASDKLDWADTAITNYLGSNKKNNEETSLPSVEFETHDLSLDFYSFSDQSEGGLGDTVSFESLMNELIPSPIPEPRFYGMLSGIFVLFTVLYYRGKRKHS